MEEHILQIAGAGSSAAIAIYLIVVYGRKLDDIARLLERISTTLDHISFRPRVGARDAGGRDEHEEL